MLEKRQGIVNPLRPAWHEDGREEIKAFDFPSPRTRERVRRKILARITEVISRPFVYDQVCMSASGDQAKSVHITNHETRITAFMFSTKNYPLTTNH